MSVFSSVESIDDGLLRRHAPRGQLPDAVPEGVNQLLRGNGGCRVAEVRQQKRDVVIAQLDLRRHVLLSLSSISERARRSNLPMIIEHLPWDQIRGRVGTRRAEIARACRPRYAAVAVVHSALPRRWLSAGTDAGYTLPRFAETSATRMAGRDTRRNERCPAWDGKN